MRGLRSLAAVAPLCLGSLGCLVAFPYEKPWIELRSQHFQIASARSEAETLELARNLEAFRSVVEVLTNVENLDPAVPTRIYAFASTNDYALYAPRGSAGYIDPSMRGNDIMLSGERGPDAMDTVQHEYAHFVLRNQSALVYPFWYDEGFAELLGAVRILEQQIQIGMVPKGRLLSFQYGSWLPIQRVVKARGVGEFPGWEGSMAYAQAWGLVHYLHFGREDRAETAQQVTRYLSLLREGVSVEAAWEDAFGMSLASLNKTLVKYLEGQIPAFGFSAEPFRADFRATTRAMSPDEIANELGWRSISMGFYAQAQQHFEAAIAANPQNARAHIGLGDAYKFQDRVEESDAHYRRGLALGDDDALNHLDYAEYLHELAASAEDAAARRERLREARQHYTRSQQLDPSLPETYAMYGSTYLLEGEDPERGIETLEHAHALLRWDLDTQLALATAYLRTGRTQQARDMLQTVIGWAEGRYQAEQARALLQQLDAGEAD